VLFGGAAGGSGDAPSAFKDDTWQWNGARWLQVTPSDDFADGAPQARSHMGFVGTLRGIELHAGTASGLCDGVTVTGRCDGLWALRGSDWRDLIPDDAEDGGPSARQSAAMAWDSRRHRAVLFGGATDDEVAPDIGCQLEGGSACGFTWEWQGSRWTQVAGTGADVPAPRRSHSMVYDPVHGVVVLFGGIAPVSGCDGSSDRDCTGTWLWDGVSWDRRCDGVPATDTCPQQPSGRHDAAMAFDERNNVVVLFGGATEQGSCDGNVSLIGCNDTWRWDGTAWSKAVVTDVEGDGDPRARSRGAMAFDAGADEIVMYGGTTTIGCGEPSGPDCAHTWTWDGRRWRKAATAPAAQAVNISMVFDRQRQRVLAIGGQAVSGAFPETIGEWDGAAWTNRAVVDAEADGSPAARRAPAVAYDEDAHVVISFGGDSGAQSDRRTWLFDSGATRGPAQISVFSFRSAGATSPTLLSISGGGSAGGTGGGVDGADLFLWDAGAWSPVASNAAAATAGSALSFSSSDPLLLDRVFVGADQAVRLMVRPGTSNGTATTLSSVSTGFSELTVTYRLP
jgi:hypothetical protein